MAKEKQNTQLIEKIKSVTSILVTVSKDPSVDQLTAALGLSLALQKMDKRAVAVFSGKIPPVMKFLQPELTFENNADSLRDFIITLSRDKVDRMQVKKDDEFVKLYVTPYHTKITKDDISYTDGDFNVELIIGIGVGDKMELDASIASHGKIFHNATTATLNIESVHDVLGMISWQDTIFSCYSEMTYELVRGLNKIQNNLIDKSIATAFLTGIVSVTEQFRNSLTTPKIMSLAAELMTKGADQQLVTSEIDAVRTKNNQPADGLNLKDSNDTIDVDLSQDHNNKPSANQNSPYAGVINNVKPPEAKRVDNNPNNKQQLNSRFAPPNKMPEQPKTSLSNSKQINSQKSTAIIEHNQQPSQKVDPIKNATISRPVTNQQSNNLLQPNQTTPSQQPNSQLQPNQTMPNQQQIFQPVVGQRIENEQNTPSHHFMAPPMPPSNIPIPSPVVPITPNDSVSTSDGSYISDQLPFNRPNTVSPIPKKPEPNINNNYATPSLSNSLPPIPNNQLNNQPANQPTNQSSVTLNNQPPLAAQGPSLSSPIPRPPVNQPANNTPNLNDPMPINANSTIPDGLATSNQNHALPQVAPPTEVNDPSQFIIPTNNG